MLQEERIRASCETRIVTQDEFDSIAGTDSNEKVVHKTIYLMKPILVPNGTLKPKKIEKTER